MNPDISLMEEYLSGPDVPDFMRYPVLYPSYDDNSDTFSKPGYQNTGEATAQEEVQGAVQEKAQEASPGETAQAPAGSSPRSLRSLGYHSYFSNLNYDGLLFSQANTASSRYFRSHRVLTPKLDPGSENPRRIGEVRARFNSFINLPTTLSDHLPTGIAYHSAVNVWGVIYIVGGIICFTREEYAIYLSRLTDGFRVPAKNVRLVFDYDLPAPLCRDKLENLAVIPNDAVLTYMPDSYTYRVLATTRGTRVRPTLCACATDIGGGSFVVYGGIEMTTAVRRPDRDHVVVTRRLRISKEFWRFDARSATFHRLEVSVHPTYNSVLPSDIARFGHRMVAVPLHNGGSRANGKTPHPGTPSKLAVVLIMGGYRARAGGRSFVAMNDLWKCDIFFNGGRFVNEAVCFPLGSFGLVEGDCGVVLDEAGEQRASTGGKFGGILEYASGEWPKPRGFFTMSLVERGSDDPHQPQSDQASSDTVTPGDTSSGTPTATPSPVPAPVSTSPGFSDKILLLQGGSTILYTKVGGTTLVHGEILGDVWWFDFRLERWHRVDTTYRGRRVEMQICGQDSYANAHHMILLGGLTTLQLERDITPLQVVGGGSKNNHLQIAREYYRRAAAAGGRATNGIPGVGVYPPEDIRVGAREDTRDCYTSFMLNLDTCKWKRVKFMYMKRLQTFFNHRSYLLYVCTPLVAMESKLVIAGGDVRKVDVKTHRAQDGDPQNVFGGNITEIYTTYLKL